MFRLFSTTVGAVLAVAALVAPASAIDIQHVANPLGVETWLAEDHSTPSVVVTFDFAGGSSQDPADRRGLTNLMVGLLYEGAGDLDSAAYKARLKEQSIDLGYDFDRDSTYGFLRAGTADLDEAVHLLDIALTAPRYDQEAVERVRGLILSGIRGRRPGGQAILGFQAALYPDHVYGVWESGDEQSISDITVSDLKDYRLKVLAQDNLKVAIVGDIDAAKAAALIQKAFGGLPAKASLKSIPDAPAPATGRIDTTADVTQTTIRFGGPGIKRADPDYLAASAAVYIFGARDPGSRLRDALVAQGGLTERVSLSLNLTKYAAWYDGQVTTTPDKADAAIAAIADEAKRFVAEGPTEDELNHARAFLVGAYLTHFQGAAPAAVELLNEMAAGFGTDYPDRFVGLAGSLTANDVQRAAARMFGGGMLVYTMGPNK